MITAPADWGDIQAMVAVEVRLEMRVAGSCAAAVHSMDPFTTTDARGRRAR